MRTVLGLAAALLVLGTGCATTKQAKLTDQPAVCGFLADACQMLQPGQKGEAAERWINSSAHFTQCNKVMITTVGFFGAAASKVPPKSQQALTDFVYKSLSDELSKKYQVVDQPGPGVAKVQVAILDAEAATPGLRSISMVVPQLRLLTSVASLGTENFPFAGGWRGH